MPEVDLVPVVEGLDELLDGPLVTLFGRADEIVVR